jgi:hypothetical protein
MRLNLLAIAALAAVAACGGGSGGPAAPSGNPFTGTSSAAGTVVRILDGTPVAGASVAIAGHYTTSDAAGRFALSGLSSFGTVRVEADGYVPRESYIRLDTPRDGIAIDLIPNTAPFSLAFYRLFARDALESTVGLRPLSRWTIPPSFYIKTSVSTGEPVPADVIDLIKSVFENSVRELSAGRMSVAAFETGASTRPAADGWVNVIIEPQLFTVGELGRSTVGGNQGMMWLRFDPADPRRYQNDPSECAAEIVKVAAHEIYHTMGYWHLTDDFLPALADPGCDGASLSDMVRYHAAVMYSRVPGNMDPDRDPSTFAFARTGGAGPIVSCTLASAAGRPGGAR